jgi:uncharacterized protein
VQAGVSIAHPGLFRIGRFCRRIALNKTLFAASAAALILSIPFAAKAQMTQTSSNTASISGTRLELQATGQSRAVPDIATISTGVVTQATDAATAMRDNAAQIARMLAALKKAGIADRDVQTQAISLAPQYRYNNNEAPVVTGYQANNTLSVRFRDIAKSGSILDILVKEGANQINGPTLSVEKPEAAQDAARLSALKTLQTRAALYAKAAGLKVKRIISMTESADFNMPPPMVVMAQTASDIGTKTSISAGEQSINITLSAAFELE